MKDIDKAFIRLLRNCKTVDDVQQIAFSGNILERKIARFILALDKKYHAKDPDKVKFITMNGAHIPIDEETGKPKIKGIILKNSKISNTVSKSVENSKKKPYNKNASLVNRPPNKKLKKTLFLPYDEYRMVIRELNTHLEHSKCTKNKILKRNIRNNEYTFLYRGFSDYDILEKRSIKKRKEWKEDEWF